MQGGSCGVSTSAVSIPPKEAKFQELGRDNTEEK